VNDPQSAALDEAAADSPVRCGLRAPQAGPPDAYRRFRTDESRTPNCYLGVGVEISDKVALGTGSSRGIAQRGAPIIVQYRSAREAAQEVLKFHLSPPGGGDAIHSQRAVGLASPSPSRSHVRCVSDARTLHGASGGPRVEIRRSLVLEILTERQKVMIA
jgi:hypothetical protein